MAKPHDETKKRKLDEKLDEALRDTFPGSDPVSFTEPAPVKEHDKKLCTVEAARKGKPNDTNAKK
jgi:hypothetical protein